MFTPLTESRAETAASRIAVCASATLLRPESAAPLAAVRSVTPCSNLPPVRSASKPARLLLSRWPAPAAAAAIPRGSVMTVPS